MTIVPLLIILTRVHFPGFWVILPSILFHFFGLLPQPRVALHVWFAILSLHVAYFIIVSHLGCFVFLH